MLEIRPNCELCDGDLPADSENAFICSYECTYCRKCVHEKLDNVCPKCGGNFSQRPIRPVKNWSMGNKLGLNYHPASTKRIHTPFSDEEISQQVAKIKEIAPRDR